MLLKEMNIMVIPVGIGSEVDVTELQELMPNVGDLTRLLSTMKNNFEKTSCLSLQR